MFQAAVGVGEQFDPGAKLFVVGLLALEQRPMGFGQRLEIDRFGMGLHDRILS